MKSASLWFSFQSSAGWSRSCYWAKKSYDLKQEEVIVCLSFKTAVELLLQLFLLFYPYTASRELMSSSFMIAISTPLLFIAVTNFKLPSLLHLQPKASYFVFEKYWFDFMISPQINVNLSSLNFKFPYLILQNYSFMNYFKTNDYWHHFIFMHFAASQEFELFDTCWKFFEIYLRDTQLAHL
jgi:hypothetical protein